MNFKDLRKEIIIIVNTIDTLESSREIALAKTKAQESMMWSGNCLKYSDEGDNPYAKLDGKRETIEDIEPMFDNTEQTADKDILSRGRIYVVDQLRVLLDKRIETLNSYFSTHNFITTDKENMKVTSMYNLLSSLCLTRMWLGMELGRIRDSR